MSTNVVHISGVIVGVFVFLISLISFLAMLTSRPDGVNVLANIFDPQFHLGVDNPTETMM